MKKFIGSVLATTLILGDVPRWKMNQKRHKNRNKICTRRNGSFKICRPRLSTTCRKDAIEFAKKHKDKIAKRGEQFLWITSV